MRLVLAAFYAALITACCVTATAGAATPKPSPIIGVYVPHATGPIWITRNQVHAPYRKLGGGDCSGHMVGLTVTVRCKDVLKS